MPEPSDATDVLAILRDGVPRTKSELAEATARARSTVSARLDELVASGLVVQLDHTVATKGRPSTTYALGTGSRVVVAVELGARHGTIALTDLAGTVLDHEDVLMEISDGPVSVLDRVTASASSLLERLGRTPAEVIGVGIGLPGPVEHLTGLPTSPPIMPGWDRFDVVGHLRATFDVPVVVDNDVNIMAIGERVTVWPDEMDLLMVKVATGIGAGIIAGGELIRGAQGAGGDIGHIQVPMEQERVCRCGQTGCLESFASGTGIARTLRELGRDTPDGRAVVDLVKRGDLDATRAVREAGRAIGQVLAAVVCMLNPGIIVLGGEIAQVGEPLLAGIREVVYQRSQPLATKQLRIVAAEKIELAGVIGASRLVQDKVFGLA